MTSKQILYTVAKNLGGDLVNAAEASKGEDFYCPVCNNELILRKSGKTGRNTKRPHFAHQTLTPNCTPESALHFTFKYLLAQKIQRHIDSNTPLNFIWDCESCYEQHSGNLTKKAKYVAVEYSLNECKPDIALLDENNNVLIVIEIVVTHKPNEKAVKYYKTNKITLIQVHLSSDQDIYKIEEKIYKPDLGELCINPKCKKCARHQHKVEMIFYRGTCWRCKALTEVVTIFGDINRGRTTVGPDKFNKQEIEFARNNGALIKEFKPQEYKEIFLANACKQCDIIIGNSYLFSDFASYSEQTKSFPIGYTCNYCTQQYDEE